MSKILIVEDEEALSDPLAFLLGREGFQTIVVDNGLDALPVFDREGADLVLLDVMLPGMSGMEVCRKLREVSSVPIIMLTAKDSELDKVLGLELGADDYVTKPYSARELIARIRAVLRRRSAETDSATESVLQGGPVRMDIDRHVVTVNGEEISMPLKEFELLERLMRNQNIVLTRDQLLEDIWGYDFDGETRTVDVHVRTLRQKLGEKGDIIKTVRGVGYRIGGGNEG